jgi:hypothetical protein
MWNWKLEYRFALYKELDLRENTKNTLFKVKLESSANCGEVRTKNTVFDKFHSNPVPVYPNFQTNIEMARSSSATGKVHSKKDWDSFWI